MHVDDDAEQLETEADEVDAIAEELSVDSDIFETDAVSAKSNDSKLPEEVMAVICRLRLSPKN